MNPRFLITTAVPLLLLAVVAGCDGKQEASSGRSLPHASRSEQQYYGVEKELRKECGRLRECARRARLAYISGQVNEARTQQRIGNETSGRIRSLLVEMDRQVRLNGSHRMVAHYDQVKKDVRVETGWLKVKLK